MKDKILKILTKNFKANHMEYQNALNELLNLHSVMHWVYVKHNNPTVIDTYFTMDDQGFMGFRTWKDTFWEGENIVGEGKVTHWMKLDPPCV